MSQPASRPQRDAARTGLAAFGVASVTLAVLAASWGAQALVSLHALVAVACAVLFFASRGRSWEVTARVHGTATLAVGTLTALALMTGQGDSIALYYLPLVAPFIAQGIKPAVIWGLIGIALAALVVLSGRLMPLEPLYVLGEHASRIGVLLTALALVYVLLMRRSADEANTESAARLAEQAELRRQLEASRDEAVGAVEAQSRLIGRVSHELRTPLNGLLGLSGLLAESRLEPAQADMARTLRASATTLKQLVDDLIDVTTLEEGRLSIHLEPVDVRDLLADIADTFAGLAERSGIALGVVVSPDVPQRLLLDGLRVRQIVSNLVGNALKFTTEGEVVIEATGVALEDGAWVCQIDVRDTGPGIPSEDLSRLFEAFEQLDDALPLRRQGSGLGLWIARQLADALGGTLKAHSVLGSGSTFSFVLSAVSAASVGGASGVFLAKAHVLVIEPDALSRRSIEALSKFALFELSACADLPAAVDAATRSAPDVVLVSSKYQDPEGVTRRLARLIGHGRFVLGVRPSELGRALPAGFVATTLEPYRLSRIRGLVGDIMPSEGYQETEPVSRMKCLVVDDDATNRMVARLLLERAGQEVMVADGAAAAWELVRERRPDVLFVDLHMPGEDGVSFTERVRALGKAGARFWIIALTAAASDEVRGRCVEAGMDDFVEKPIDMGLFRAALERAYRGIRRRSRSSRAEIEMSLIDAATADEMAQILQEEFAPLVEELAASGAELLASLRAAVESGDQKTAHRAAHTLKSSTGQLGATLVATMARHLEAGLSADPPAWPTGPVLRRLEETFEQSIALLRARELK